ncbi:MAG: hypothetical protein R8J41_11075 [Alphaproteobacteria bacterium]|nr:hypothetical protein [Alphaproteobacteria bacterium]
MKTSSQRCRTVLAHILVLFPVLLFVTPSGTSTASAMVDTHQGLGWIGTSNEGEPSPEARALVTRITEMVGIKPEIEVRAADFAAGGTAFATVRKGRRYIVYDRAKFDWKNGQASFANLGIMAHEIGHHVASHLIARGASRHAVELEADRFAGFALARLGAGIVEAQEMFRADWPASRTHPASPDRRAAVRAGWLAGKAEGLRYHAVCRAQLLSTDVDVEGRVCRVVNTCSKKQPHVGLACQDARGKWQFEVPGP